MTNKELNALVDVIGAPATLETMAEEATELAHACQKAARLLRDETRLLVTLWTNSWIKLRRKWRTFIFVCER